MAAYSNYALRVPSSLMADLRDAAERDGVSMNGFVVQAVAEKIAALRARGLLHALSAEEQARYLASRSAQSREGVLAEVLRQAGKGGAAVPGDDIPSGWQK